MHLQVPFNVNRSSIIRPFEVCFQTMYNSIDYGWQQVSLSIKPISGMDVFAMFVASCLTNLEQVVSILVTKVGNFIGLVTSWPKKCETKLVWYRLHVTSCYQADDNKLVETWWNNSCSYGNLFTDLLQTHLNLYKLWDFYLCV